MRNFPVLLFHSTDDRDLLSFKGLGNIGPELFERLIVMLKKEFDIVSLEELVRHISGDKRDKDRILALTFDDGPKSYATCAVPVMESYGLPSTCFLITDCIGDQAIYWRYLYNYCINKGRAKQLAGLINREYAAGIRAEEIVSYSRSHYNRAMNRRIITRLLDNVVPEGEYREEERDLFLSLEDIRRLKKNPLVGFGIHTRSHAVMKGLADEEISDEIAGSLDFYRSEIGDNTPMFSVPFGRLFKDYDERTISIAKSLSVNTVLSAYGGGNAEGQPLYNIRRVPVHEEKLNGGIGHFIGFLSDPLAPAEYAEKEKRLDRLLSVEK
jgi:peptidoglycan/xylan/chitin deacetylase (PgdA/CDA1 family)